jgi:hypothetical protein
MLVLKLITSMDQVEALTGLTICKATPAPPNCRTVATAAIAPVKTPTRAADPKKAAVAPAPAAPAKASLPTEYVSIPGKAQPTNTSAMRFVVARGGSPLCEPNCPEWISAEGVITSMTPNNLADFLKTIGNRQLPVVISSSGGDLYAALAAGRLIRKHALDTAVGRTHFIHCAPEKADCKSNDRVYIGAAIAFWGECGDACAMMLAGGVRRLVGPEAKVSVREPVVEQSVRRYLDEMMISPRLLALMKAARWQPLELGQQTMLRVKLVTGPEDAEILTASTICKSMPQPANCRVVSAAQ